MLRPVRLKGFSSSSKNLEAEFFPTVLGLFRKARPQAQRQEDGGDPVVKSLPGVWRGRCSRIPGQAAASRCAVAARSKPTSTSSP